MTDVEKARKAIKAHNASVAKIHIAKNQLGMSDDTYRAMLKSVAGVTSSKDLTPQGIDKVIKHLKGLGAEFTLPKSKGKRPHNLHSQADKAKQLQKIEALLADMGLHWNYAKAMAKQMYKKDALEFCGPRELTGIIAALTKKQQKQVKA